MTLQRLALLVLGLWAAGSTALAAGQHRTNGEYGFSVDFPSGLPVCIDGSSQYPHGWQAALSGTCNDSRRAIRVMADGNAESAPTAELATACSKLDLAAGGRLRLTFSGRPSAACREDQSNGSILVTVVTQFGKQAGPYDGEPGETFPEINYFAVLKTMPHTFAGDLATFRRVLGSVRIHGPPPPPAPVLTSQLRTTLIRINGGVDSFLGDVELRVENAAPTDARVSIRCVSLCRAAFSDTITGSPLGAVALPDFGKGDINLLLVWQGPTAYGLAVYHLMPDDIRPVLETGTNAGWPTFTTDGQGRDVIVVPDSIDVGGGERYPKTERVYRWDGKAFELEHRARINSEAEKG